MTKDKTNTISLDMHRFKALISAYGSDIAKWPEDSRSWAQTFSRDNIEAQNLLSYEKELDEILTDVESKTLNPEALTHLQYKIVSSSTRLPQQKNTDNQRALMGSSIQSLTACFLLCGCLAAGMLSLPYLPLDTIVVATESEQSIAFLEINLLSSWD